jgi:penicillin-binding protein 1C
LIFNIVRSLAVIAIIFAILSLIFPLSTEEMKPPLSTRIFDRNGDLLHVYLSESDSYCFQSSVSEISPFVISATLTYEDRLFFYHPGINPVSILKAMKMNFEAGRVISGGSTITQQLARLMNPKPRTIVSKLIEVFRAFQLELCFSKEELLETYFALAPYGGNIVGVEAASQIYYGKSASELGPGEAALLAGIPTSPTKLRPDRYPESAKGRRDIILERMFDKGDIDEERYRLSLSESIPVCRVTLPSIAPHYCDMIVYNLEKEGDVRTKLDSKTYTLADKLLKRHIQGEKHLGIGNGAVVVLDNQSGEILAMVGSEDYNNTEIQGQVNGTLALRSPGSTLKPFVYALALEKGMITQSTLIEDIPVNYSGYAPENYDTRFHGVVTAEQALSRSMNVPAVNLTRQVGLTNFIEFLKLSGVKSLVPKEDHYGLSIILGGLGINLLDLTMLYSSLANGGELQQPIVIDEKEYEERKEFFSPGTAYVITEMLSKVKRPDFPSAWQSTVHLPKIAWKTGTSYSHRDAWSIGYTSKYTIGVWIGNFSGVGNPSLIGADMAAPLLFDIFSSLEHDGGTWFKRPPSVIERDVCAVSGKLPTTACKTLKREIADEMTAPTTKCDLHIELLVDKHTGERLCPHCRSGREASKHIYTSWVPSISTWMRDNGRAPEPLPSHSSSCTKMLQNNSPEILSPAENCSYVIRSSVPLVDQQILLEAHVMGDTRKIYWFVDGVMIYSGTPNGSVYYLPKRGHHEVVCMDDEGRRSSRILHVL